MSDEPTGPVPAAGPVPVDDLAPIAGPDDAGAPGGPGAPPEAEQEAGQQSPGEAAPGEQEPVTGSAPAVVAVVVTRNPGAVFDEALAALRDADYPALTVLVVDAASEVDPTERIARLLPGAFVRRLPDVAAFPEAANEGARSVEGATFLLLLHDDVVLDADAVRLLVEEAYRSNAAIVGPKLVDHDRPEVLVEVGGSIDRFGVPHTDIEPGELDQEQHDAVQDVFFVSSEAMLVRADLWRELDGFDPLTAPAAEDLDLCWRARIAGARVMVAPDARARRAARQRTPDEQAARFRDVPRARVRAVLKAYSGWTLARVVPAGIVLAVVEAIALAVTRRGARGRAVLRGWAYNLTHWSELRADRARAQQLRAVPDRDLRFLQSRGSARVRSFFSGQLHAEDRIRSVQQRSRELAGTAGARAREPIAVAAIIFAAAILVGSRSLIFGTVPAVGEFQAWAGMSGMWEAFTSAWRVPFAGSPSPAPPLFALMSGASALLLGASGLARTLVVVGALPLAAFGAWRLGRAVTGAGPAAVVAGLAYGINPLPRSALAEGRLGPLITYALLPFLVLVLVRTAGVAVATAPVRRWWAGAIGAGAVLAVMTAAWPPALLAALVVAAAFAIGAALGGEPARTGRLLGVAFAATIVAKVLLLPWPFAFLAAEQRAAAAGFVFPADVSATEMLRFQTGPAGAGAGGVALVVAAFLVLALGAGARFAWAARVWMLVVVSFALVWVPVAADWTGVPAPEGVLAPAALGVALAVGLGVAAFFEDVRRTRFGWRQVVAIAGAVVLVLPVIGFTVDALGGRWRLPGDDWAGTLSWMPAEAAAGEFRVLWLGEPGVLPLDPYVVGGVGFGTTRNGPGDARDLLPPSATGGNATLPDAVALLAGGGTNRIGRVLATYGVRYVAVPDRAAPGAPRVPVPRNLRRSLGEQVDLLRLETTPGIAVYENRAWIPIEAVVPPGRVVSGPRTGFGDLVGTDLSGSEAIGAGPAPGGTVVLSESYDSAWQATRGDRSLPHDEVFGWANGFPSPQPGPVRFDYADQWQRWLAVAAQLAVVIAAVVAVRGRGLRIRRRSGDDT